MCSISFKIETKRIYKYGYEEKEAIFLQFQNSNFSIAIGEIILTICILIQVHFDILNFILENIQIILYSISINTFVIMQTDKLYFNSNLNVLNNNE